MLFLFLVLLCIKPPLNLEMSRSERFKYHSYLNIPISNNTFFQGYHGMSYYFRIYSDREKSTCQWKFGQAGSMG